MLQSTRGARRPQLQPHRIQMVTLTRSGMMIRGRGGLRRLQRRMSVVTRTKVEARRTVAERRRIHRMAVVTVAACRTVAERRRIHRMAVVRANRMSSCMTVAICCIRHTAVAGARLMHRGVELRTLARQAAPTH